MNPYHKIVNHINGVMVSILSSSVVDNWFKPGRVKSKTPSSHVLFVQMFQN